MQDVKLLSESSSSDNCEIFNLSLCSIYSKEKEFFKEVMNYKFFKTELRYRGSRDGWMKADFHRMSDEKGPTVTLFKV